MDRRAFIETLTGGLLAAPLAAEARQASFSSADLPPTEDAAPPTSIPATLSPPRRAVGSVPAVVIGSSRGRGGQRARRRAPDRPATPAGVGDATLVRGAASWALAVVVAAAAVETALVHGQVRDVGPIERVTLRSGSYADFRHRGAPNVLVDARAQPFDPDALAACVAAGPGCSMAFDATTRTKSTADTVAFLQRHLRP